MGKRTHSTFTKTVSSKCRDLLCPKTWQIVTLSALEKYKHALIWASSSALPLPQRGWCYHHTISATTGSAGSREQNGQFLPWGTSLLLLPAGAVGHILSHMVHIHLDVVEYVKGKCLGYRGVFTRHWCYWVLHWDDRAINTGAVYTEPFPWKSQAIYMLIIPLNASE